MVEDRKKEKAIEKIKELVTKYKKLVENKQIRQYNEERTKNDFIDHLFEALGWDVWNKKVYDEVLKEEKVLKGRVDYAFRLNGVNKFFVEAKSLKADLENPDYAKQAIEYGFNKAVAFVVLTDFEGLKVFNAEWNEKNIWRNIVFEIKYDQYEKEIDKLWLLSRDSIEKGLLTEYAKSIGKRTPRKGVEELLPLELISWRNKISKDIKLNYSTGYDDGHIDEITQKLIDRLIFIRTCEDRKFENKQLLEAANMYKKSNRKLSRLLKDEIFPYYRREYDSNLFGKDEEDIHEIDQINISDDVLYDVITSTYYSKDGNAGYDFDVIEADVLGNAYEQYLGYVLRTTAKRIKTEYKHAHRKEQGIYYTPKEVVAYIVRNTIGDLISNKKPKEVDNIKIVDPACGSGSFLIRAFDELRNYYIIKEKARQETMHSDFDLKRTTQILKNNIFGVDLDEKAVEIAQLNLMLKVAEKRHRLPLLKENIKCGNSLIDDPETAGPKSFNWEEKFPRVFKEGKFDIVVGNPPWVQSKYMSKEHKMYYSKKYTVAKKQYDLFSIFIERSLQQLKENGILGFIVPDRFIANLDYWPFREFILNNCRILKLVHLGDDVFKEVSMPSAILIIKKEKSKSERDKNVVEYAECAGGKSLDNLRYNKKSQEEFLKNEGFVFSIFSIKSSDKIISKIRKHSVKFGEIVDNARGVEIGKNSELISDKKLNESYVKFLTGEDIDRYKIDSKRYIRLNERNIDYKSSDLYKGSKILIRKTGLGIKATLDTEGHYVIQVIYIFKPKKKELDTRYLLGILNSKLMEFYYFSVFGEKGRKTFPHLTQGKVLQLPIRIATDNQQKLVISLVDEILQKNKRLTELGDKKVSEKSDIEEQIKKLNKKIDDVVYKIYDLSLEEIKIIEESLK